MSLLIICTACADGRHEKCHVASGTHGVMGGWRCTCVCRTDGLWSEDAPNQAIAARNAKRPAQREPR